jgi:hypothetical protein
MTTKPNAGPPIICGRPYVLFDPEQTAEIKRAEKIRDAQDRVVKALNEALEAVDYYSGHIVETDGGLAKTVEEATRKLRHLAGVEFDEYLGSYHDDNSLKSIEWRGEVAKL